MLNYTSGTRDEAGIYNTEIRSLIDASQWVLHLLNFHRLNNDKLSSTSTHHVLLQYELLLLSFINLNKSI